MRIVRLCNRRIISLSVVCGVCTEQCSTDNLSRGRGRTKTRVSINVNLPNDLPVDVADPYKPIRIHYRKTDTNRTQ